MPVLTCGGMRYQHAWKDTPLSEIPKANQENLEATIRRALELGINHIETARGYGSSEVQLGQILPTFPREELIVQTKVAPSEKGEDFRQVLDTCMDRLRLDYVDLLGVHGINNHELLDRTLAKGGTMDVCRELQREGRVRFVGFSTHAPCDVITRACATGEFDYVNLHWYYVNQINWPAIEEATRQDMGVFIISPNDKGGKLYEPSAKLVELCEPLHPMIFNDLFCLARPQVHTLSIGAARPSDFDIHVEAVGMLDQAEELSAPIAERIESALRESLGAGWEQPWDRQLPEFHDVPGELNVKEIARLWAYARALDMTEFGKMRYNLLGNAGHWFPGQKAETFDDEVILAAVEGSPIRNEIPGILREAHEMLVGEEKKRLSES